MWVTVELSPSGWQETKRIRLKGLANAKCHQEVGRTMGGGIGRVRARALPAVGKKGQ